MDNLDATVEVEKVVEEAPVEKSIDDTLRETLQSLKAQGKEIVEEPPKDQPRDLTGKFKALEAAPAVVDPAMQSAAEVIPPAPNTWKKEGKEVWTTLPALAREEILRRETDFHNGIEQYKSHAQFGQTIEKAISPYLATIQSLGIAPDKAIGDLMAADHRLRYSSPQEKTAFFAQLARNYGIDIANVSAPEFQQVDPNIAALQERLQRFETQQQQAFQSQQQQQQAALNSEIATFAADPAHVHFESVKGHMSALLQAGQATSLADAYEQAVYANPVTRTAMLEQQAKAQREEQAKKAQAAKDMASINVRPKSSLPASQPIGSMEDTIRATLRKMQAA